MIKSIIGAILAILFIGCKSGLAPVAKNALKPTVVTKKTPNDTDDPAIWINPKNVKKSLIIGTDKAKKTGGLYTFDLNGKITNKVTGLNRPNNVDVAYNFSLNGKPVDLAIVTERGNNQLRVFGLPDLKPLDNGGIPVFEDSSDKKPMGIAVYRSFKSQKNYAIVSRKFGPSGEYLYQYELIEDNGIIKGKLVRRFGKFSGKKEIEAIAVDNKSGYIYYSDEIAGIRKYYAEPEDGDEELAFFGTKDFKRDIEGIAIYKKNATDGYLLVSDQQANVFNVYKTQGEPSNKHLHQIIAKIPFSSVECDGADATHVNLGASFPEGLMVTMSNGRVFQFYNWEIIQKEIDIQSSRK